MNLVNSRYSNFFNYTQIRHYNFSRLLTIYGYTTYICKQFDTIEQIAYFKLKDASLYWVILGCSNVVNPFLKLEIGQKLIIPNERIITEINR